MTNQTDSFIDEVTDEVRRDRLYSSLRRYGWIGILAVVLIVGGAAWTEWQAAQERARAEALGDALLAAMLTEEPEARIAALDGVAADGAARAVAGLLTAAEELAAGEPAAAAETLNAVAADGAVPVLYRDLAALKALMIADAPIAPADRRTALEALAQPGGRFALLASEQLALAEIAAGETEAARARLRALSQDANATQGLRDRAEGLIVALGQGDGDEPVAEDSDPAEPAADATE